MIDADAMTPLTLPLIRRWMIYLSLFRHCRRFIYDYQTFI